MARTSHWLSVPLAAALLLPATASADITPMRTTADAVTLANAISDNGSFINPATTEFSTIAPDDPARDDDNQAALATTPLTSFPLNGSPSYAILSSGDATHADQPNDVSDFSTDLAFQDTFRGPQTYDPVTLDVGFNATANQNCLVVRFRFLSEEYPEYVGSSFNDAFIAELDTSDWATTNENEAIVAPHNFAFDEKGNPITVNDAGASTFSAENANGTTYDGATRRLAAVTPITPGAHKLFLSVFDRGDDALDSSAFIDNMELLHVDSAAKCSGATFFDDAPPNLSTGGVALPAGESEIGDGGFTKDTTPSFAGKGGTTINDDTTVTGNFYAGSVTRAAIVNGTPVQSKSVPVADDGSWVVTADALPDGDYTFQATQGSKNGPSASTPIHFSIDNAAPATTIGEAGFFAGRTRDLTPLLTGGAGAAKGDNPAVSVSVFAGKAASGTPVAGVAAAVAGAAWSAQLPALKAGTYTATASQGDAAGNRATATRTFTITTANPIGKVKTAKKLSRAKAAKGLKGSLAFAFPGKVKFTLTAKAGKKTLKIGSVSKTLAAPGTARFNLKPKKGVAARIRSSRGKLILKTSFTDDQGRRYSRTQTVKFS